MAKRDPNRLTRRTDGRWCKKFRGVYWTSRSKDPDEAQREWLAAKPGILDGQAVANFLQVGAEPTVRDVVNEFLSDRQDRLAAGTMTGRTAAAYIKAARSFAEIVGPEATVRELAPDDFAKARAAWAAELGPWKLSERVTAV